MQAGRDEQRLAGQKSGFPISGNTQYEAGMEGDGLVRLSWTEVSGAVVVVQASGG